MTKNAGLRTLTAGLVTGALLLIEHLLLYDPEAGAEEPELSMLGSNIMGTATIGIGVAIAAESQEETVRYATVASIAGTCVLVIRLVRRSQRLRDLALSLREHTRGKIDGVLQYEQFPTFRGSNASD